MNKFLFNLIVFAEVIIITTLGVVIYRRLFDSRDILGSATVAPIFKGTLKENNSPELEYFFEFKPNLVIEDKRDWLPETVKYDINNDSLNERFDYEVYKPENVFRIVTLGDSFTFGLLVNTESSWPEQLEMKLNNNPSCDNKKYEVINLGMPNYGVEYIAYRYEHRGQKYNPDLIIWLESGTGFYRINELSMPITENYESKMAEEERANSVSNGDYVAAIQAYNTLLEKYSKSQLADMAMSSWNRFIDKLKSEKLVLATFSNIENENKELFNEWLRNKKQVLFYFGLPDLKKHDLVLKDGHPNVEGHKIIANKMFEMLIKNDLILCNN